MFIVYGFVSFDIDVVICLKNELGWCSEFQCCFDFVWVCGKVDSQLVVEICVLVVYKQDFYCQMKVFVDEGEYSWV